MGFFLASHPAPECAAPASRSHFHASVSILVGACGSVRFSIPPRPPFSYEHSQNGVVLLMLCRKERRGGGSGTTNQKRV